MPAGPGHSRQQLQLVGGRIPYFARVHAQVTGALASVLWLMRKLQYAVQAYKTMYLQVRFSGVIECIQNQYIHIYTPIYMYIYIYVKLKLY